MKRREFESLDKVLAFDVSLFEVESTFEQMVKEFNIEKSIFDEVLNALKERFLPVAWFLILGIRDLARNPDHSMADSFLLSARKEDRFIYITLSGRRGEFYNAHSSGAVIDLANGCRLKVASAQTAIKELIEIYEMINDESSIVGTVVNTHDGPVVQWIEN